MKSTSTKLWLVLLLSAFQFSASSQTNHLVISQLFGSGGVSATLPSHDFIELYNPTGAAVNLNGWSVQFTFGSATAYTKIPLSGTIMAKGYYLIRLGRDAYYAGTAMPTPDLTFNYNINSPDMKIGLYHFTSLVSGANPSATAIDFVGTGAATGYETQPSPQGAYNVSLMRKSTSASTVASLARNGSEYTNGNGYDTDNNLNDLLLTPNVIIRSANSGLLAVHFLSFDLSKTTAGNQLRWQVADAQDAVLFEVEKSTDGVVFSRVGSVTPQGAAYTFVDAGTAASAYYRVKAVSKEGKPQYSATLFAEGRKATSLAVFPTLASSNLTVQVPAGKSSRVSIYTADGRLQQQVTIADKQTQVSVSVAALKPGTYFVRFTSFSGETGVERFVKAG